MKKFNSWLELKSAVKNGDEVFYQTFGYKLIYHPNSGDFYVKGKDGYFVNLKDAHFELNKFFTQTKIGKSMKLKKGSKAAKDFMAKIRAKKKTAKKVGNVVLKKAKYHKNDERYIIMDDGKPHLEGKPF